MKFKIKVTEIFLEQVKKFKDKDKKLVKEKIELIRKNPYRFKRIHSKKFSRVFRIRLNLSGREMRLVYIVASADIILVCLLERKRNYNDLEKYLRKL
ncbi:MAG: hypothetical protein B6U68_04275 [Candidatus Aenigmarchaeota archaeon ex4484_14]|nr:MAG: hypothetical protein B6U68_04275 [Candidatus Aenigmarchaeota archaeon ex4484_14]